MGKRRSKTLSFILLISEQYFEAISRFSYSCAQHIGKQIGQCLFSSTEGRKQSEKNLKKKVSSLAVLPECENQERE